MKIAFIGKGGSGKTTLVSLFALRAAASGAPVLALDSNQNLAVPLRPHGAGLRADPARGRGGAPVRGLRPRLRGAPRRRREQDHRSRRRGVPAVRAPRRRRAARRPRRLRSRAGRAIAGLEPENAAALDALRSALDALLPDRARFQADTVALHRRNAERWAGSALLDQIDPDFVLPAPTS